MNIKFNTIEPPKKLEEKIFAQLAQAAQKESFKRTIIGYFGIVASLFASIELFAYLLSELQQSGFYQYLSLIQTDFKTVVGDFGVYALSLVNSIPFSVLSFTLLSIFTLLVSARYVCIVRNQFVYQNNF